MNKEINGEMINIPEHVAIIMDGNGRWAKKRLMPRTYGHSEGAKAIERTCENADELGIKYLTVYAFSTENWKRSVEEVSTIMNIFRKYLVDSIERSNRNNMRVRIIGKREDLPEDIVEKMYNLEKATANNTGLQFSVAINYGGRDEITRAVRQIASDCMAGKLSPDAVTEDDSQFLPRYKGTDGSGSVDSYQRRASDIEFSSMADRIFGILFYGCVMAGL